VQDDEPVLLAYLPDSHSVQFAAEPSENLPTAQREQFCDRPTDKRRKGTMRKNIYNRSVAIYCLIVVTHPLTSTPDRSRGTMSTHT
jgi:hypothetical protein